MNTEERPGDIGGGGGGNEGGGPSDDGGVLGVVGVSGG